MGRKHVAHVIKNRVRLVAYVRFLVGTDSIGIVGAFQCRMQQASHKDEHNMGQSKQIYIKEIQQLTALSLDVLSPHVCSITQLECAEELCLHPGPVNTDAQHCYSSRGKHSVHSPRCRCCAGIAYNGE